MVVKAGDDTQSASPVTGDGYKQQYYVAIETPPHSHSFICSASSDAITATCTNGDGRCDLTDCKVTLKIVAPTLTIFGGTGDGTATLEGLSDFNAATDMGVAEAQITYEGRTDTTYEMSTAAPTDAGGYTARITLENVVTSEGENNSVTAFVDYTIARAAAPHPGTITDEQKPQARTGDDVIYTGSPITLVTAPSSLPAGCTKVQYSIDGGETWTDEAPAATGAGTYFVWYRFVGDKNHLDLAAAEPIEVVIVKLFGTPDFILPMQLTGIEESAFEGVSDMTVVDAHSCKTIGKDAFKNTGLKQIRLPKDCEIDAGAFGEQEVYVFAPAGGTTQAYCASHDNLIFIEE